MVKARKAKNPPKQLQKKKKHLPKKRRPKR
jgi:hypothetical protein